MEGLEEAFDGLSKEDGSGLSKAQRKRRKEREMRRLGPLEPLPDNIPGLCIARSCYQANSTHYAHRSCAKFLIEEAKLNAKLNPSPPGGVVPPCCAACRFSAGAIPIDGCTQKQPVLHSHPSHAPKPAVTAGMSSKLLAIKDLVTKIRTDSNAHIKKDDKVLIFSGFKMFLDLIESMLMSEGYGVERFDGDDSPGSPSPSPSPSPSSSPNPSPNPSPSPSPNPSQLPPK
mmetsp:Transcript_72984/g.208017  ORF Transcript_72984/g.208017 Transcript_72984/m.208017 type:complete len:229 (+) Transcript_72984:512-1198(+)